MKTKFRASLIAVAIATLPLGAFAAGLGRINVFTGLGQPLRAEVEVTGSSEEIDSINARVASQDTFRNANLEYPAYFSSLKFAVEKRANGALIKISSDKPIDEPFVDMLLELNWAGGRLVREYTFLLDPIDTKEQLAARPLPTAPAARGADETTSPNGVGKTRGGSVAIPKSVARTTVEKPVATGDYVVKPGDTLSRIANQAKPNDASLEQMLAALYTTNSSSFAKGDINRLMAGQVLKLPEANEVKGISREEAHKVLSAPSTNFSAYRQKMAAAVAAAPAKESAAQQSVSGKITPKVEEPAVLAESGDKLKISRTQIAKKGTAAEDNSAANRVLALESDLVAREKALKEANERAAQLETNVQELQKLVEMKNQALADLQKQAKASAQSAVPVAKPDPVAAAQSATPTEAAQPTAEAAQSAPVVAEASAPAAAAVEQSEPAAKPKKAIEPPPEEEPDFIDSMLENAGSLAAGLGALILALVGWLIYRKRKAKPQTDFDRSPPISREPVLGPADDAQMDEAKESSAPAPDSVPSFSPRLASTDDDENVDPLAEADVYIAYGRDTQAEQILLDALKSEPERTAVYVKLLEIYHQRKSVKKFENIATDLHALTRGEGPDWARAVELGAQIDPENPLYRYTSEAEPAIEEVAAPVADAEPLAFSFDEPEPEPVAPALTALDSDSSLQMQATWTVPGDIGQVERNAPVQSAVVDVPAATKTDDLGLDFNLDLDAAPDQTQPVKPFGVFDPLEFGTDTEPGIDDLSDAAPVAPEAEKAAALARDLDDFDALPSLDDEAAIAPSVAAEADALIDLEKTNFKDDLLDFDIEHTEPVEEHAIDLSDIDLELTPPTVDEHEEALLTQIEAPPDEASLDEDLDVNEEVATKLELARAYEEMRDFEGARELLEEVMADGSRAQKREAEAILARLA